MNAVEKLYLNFCEKKKRLPYHINVIDELHANENAHTRILKRLLQYRKDGGSFILKSFLQQVQAKLSVEIQTCFAEILHQMGNGKLPEIFFNRDNIDCLIAQGTEYAIIIENKVHWATDQNKQIERYVETMMGYGVAQENIYVIYLTPNENKIVSDYSFTEQAQKWLGTSENDTGRFIPMNYTSEILPWLENTVLPSCTIGEEWLISALRQYIDHLKGMFGKREAEKKNWDETKKEVTVQAIREYDSLPEDSPEREFMENLILSLQSDLEICFCDCILDYALRQKGLHNPGGWYPVFGEKWGRVLEINPTDENDPVINGVDLEKFWYGIAWKEEDFSKEWSDAYWKTFTTLVSSPKRNKWYWLGARYLSDRDFCSKELLCQLLEENAPSWEQSNLLREKAEKIAEEIFTFYSAVKEAAAQADKFFKHRK